VLTAVLLAAVAGEDLLVAGATGPALDVGPLDSLGSAATAVWAWLVHEPAVLAGAILMGTAAAALPWARQRSPFGAAGVGLVVVAACVLAGASVASTAAAMLAWAAFALACSARQRTA
jgi:hypothetical protein